MANEIVTAETESTAAEMAEELIWLYDRLPKANLLFAEKVTTCLDFNEGSDLIKHLWDSFWKLCGEDLRVLFEFFSILDKEDSWQKIKEYMCLQIESALRSETVVISKPQKPLKPRENKEQLFESKLEAFLQVNEIEVERQVTSEGKRLDLWLPGQLMIECKAGRVTGDDVCQAIDYLATFKRDVLLVGTGMSSAASRGIEAINKISGQANILFVTQEACFGYLNSVCR